ncbi:RHS repeat-associated protein [Duganella sp. 3397]|uniref:RHS repeat-associated core domain-containing protein n=1 Tax=Duganella sp. 3397 TaxID=2817732 RepID=UPI00285DC48F|nr:RHS repeat-associated core domain-containing protein [Duganella sp. 3397]MDR7050138.1 RHS repeat-associated protein [Duganella sp. 3397]
MRVSSRLNNQNNLAVLMNFLPSMANSRTAMRQLFRLLITLMVVGAPLAHAQVPGNPLAYSRSSSFEYYPTTGLLKSEVVEPGTSACVNTTYTYDAYGNKTGATVSNCGSGGNAAFATRSSTTAYAAYTVAVAGRDVSVPAGTFQTNAANALQQTETKQFDPRFGVTTSLTGPNALTTKAELDEFGRTVRERHADNTGSVTAYCYLPERGIADVSSNSPHCPSTAREEWTAEAISFVHSEPRDQNDVKNGPFSRVYMDRAGRKVRTVTEAFDGATQPGGAGRLIVQDTDYNAQGATVLVTEPYFLDSKSSISGGRDDYGMTFNLLDALGRVVRTYTSDPKGLHGVVQFGTRRVMNASKEVISYSGMKVTSTNDLGQTRIEEKNVDGRVVLVTDALGAQIAHQYDAFGNLIQTRDALQNVITIAYDVRGRKTSQNDPDTGLWQYDYNALGELVWQQSPNQRALNQSTTLGYDVLGRLTTRNEPEFISYWSYDKHFDGSACVKGIGKLCGTSTTNGISRKYAYDALGRPVSTRTDITGGPSFASGARYDAGGRVVSQIYPTGVQVNYQYTAKGFLSAMTLAQAATITPLPGANGAAAAAGKTLAAGSLLWQGQAYNAWGKSEQHAYGNNVTSRTEFESVNGRIRTMTAAAAGAGAGATIMDYRYEWNSLSYLAKRTDANGNGSVAVTDDYLYDPIGRLTDYTVSSPAIAQNGRTVSIQYNALGSVLYKSDVGNYSYPAQGAGAVRPHALQAVSGAVPASYTYDANGNLTGATAGAYRKISYTSFNLPDAQNGLEGPNGYPRYSWQYDENHQRVKETHAGSTGSRVTWMMHPDNVGGLGFESEQLGSGVSNRHYLSVQGMSLGVLITTGNVPSLAAGQMEPGVPGGITAVKLEYWHKDLQGSLITTTDHNGTVTARYSYDPFGKRRMAGGAYDASGNLVIDWNNTSSGTDRGYTGHEHLDDVGVIHMNGRIFDPRLGMFMQADPYIQDPLGLQNYNRYTYCYNSPLTCTDPSGYLFNGLIKIKAIDNLWNKHIKQYVPMIASIAVAVYMPGMLASMQFGPFSQAVISGFASGAVGSGNLKGGLQGAFTAGMFYGAGTLIKDAGLGYKAGISIHAVVGCVTSAAGGGKCGQGALSAAFSNALTPTVAEWTKGNTLAGAATSAVIGGTASVLGGGKFSNGATTAAFGYLFNHSLHPSDPLTEEMYPGQGGCGCNRTAEQLGEALSRAIDKLGAILSESATLKVGIQYSLRATVDGLYPDVRDGTVELKAGDVWKYGETTQLGADLADIKQYRYSGALLRRSNLKFVVEHVGTQTSAKFFEAVKLNGYVMFNWQLPPGNKTTR